jgi:hypothetical protein
MLEHLSVDLEQESKEALATWVLVQKSAGKKNKEKKILNT